jgi:tetratricopeptide (TPR) repeat protein
VGKKGKKLAKKRISEASSDKKDPKASCKLKWWHRIFPPVLISAITAAFYYPSLKYPFQFDDLANITKKFDIRHSDPLSMWWRNRRWMGEWLNRLNFEWGRFDPYYYRLTNLIVHILAGIFVFWIILEGCAHLKKSSFFSRNALAIASTTSVLFLLHPVQTQAVSYVIQARLEGLATLFVLATLFLILKAFHSKNAFLKYSLLALSLGVGFVSCGTKEIAIVSPFLALLVDWFFISEQNWKSFKSRIWFHAIFSFTIFATFVHYLSINYISKIAGLKVVTYNNKGNVLTKKASDIITPFAFMFSSFKVILHYLQIFLWPFDMSVEYDWKLSESFFAPDSFFPFLFLSFLFFTSAYSLIKNKHPFFGFGLIWFLVAIAPRSTIIPSPELICDYKTYLSSVGWLFVISTALVATVSFLIKSIKNVPSWFYKRSIQFAAVIIFSFPVGYSAMSRNLVWSSSIAFWQDIVKKAPAKARGHNNLGVALSEQNRFEESIPRYLEAIRLDRHYSDPWSNLAVAYSFKGDIDRAIKSLKQAIRIHPNYPEAFNNLGTLLIKKKNYDVAEKALTRAIQLRPYYGKAFYNLGRMYLEKGKDEKAWQYFKRATEGDLDTKEGFYTLAQMSLKLKKYEHAITAFESTLRRGGAALQGKQKEGILFGLANSYFMGKKYNKAESAFKILYRSNPRDHRYIYNLCETLYSNKKFGPAIKWLKKLVSPPFNLVQANIRLAHCLEKTKKMDEAQKALKKVVNSEKMPVEMRELAKREMGRIKIQKKINSGNCTLTMKDLKQAFKTKS